MTMYNKALFVVAAICSAAAIPAHAQQGAPEDPTIKDTANKVTEPFDGKEIPPKLLEIQ